MELERRNVQLQVQVANKVEAIHAAGNLLVASQYIKAGYIDSMLAREKVANTFLGNGIAIPHGLPKDRDLIQQDDVARRCVCAKIEEQAGIVHRGRYASRFKIN